MTPDEYSARQAVISAAAARYTIQFGTLFSKPALSLADWLGLLSFLFPQIGEYRRQSAVLAREFYDSQRLQHHPGLPRNDSNLEGYSFERFMRDMDPAKKQMSQADSPENAIGQVASHATRAVENAGRQQIIHSVEDDPAEHIVRGWARVATGRETCAWCLMLVSRGPVYLGADSAGLDLDDDHAVKLIESGEDVSAYMQQWHPNCDCKVVPVFKLESWPGKDEADRALELWNEATREASRLIESGDSRTDNRNREALNALRRRIDRGEITASEWTALSAA